MYIVGAHAHAHVGALVNKVEYITYIQLYSPNIMVAHK